MEDCKEKYELSSIVTATRIFNRETITGKFGGFYLLDKFDPKSIVGVVHTPNGSYDVEPNSIESVISEDERIRKGLLSHLRELCEYKGTNPPIKMPEHYSAWIAWLEKQGEQKPTDKDDTLMSLDEAIAHCKEKSCGDNACALEHKQLGKWLTELKELKEQKPAWSEDDEKELEQLLDILHANTYESFDKWLKSLKERIKGE